MISLTRSHDLSYGLLEQADFEEMAELLASVFSRFEPPAVAAGLTLDDVREVVRHVGQNAAADKLTVIARLQPAGTIVGAMLTDDFVSPASVSSDALPRRFAPIGALLEALDGRYRTLRHPAQGRFLHLFMLGVTPDFGGRGIAGTLVRLVLDNGKKRGYDVAVTEATGKISQHVFLKQGFRECFRVAYQEFRYDREAVFESIADQGAAILMERDLKA